MKFKSSLISFLLFVILSALPSLAQMTTVKGVAKDTEGKPIVGGSVDMVSHENGRKISLKTGKNGEFMSIGVPPGNYHVFLLKDGKQIWDADNYQVSLSAPNGENILDLDLQKKQQQAVTGNAKGMTEEQKKQMQEALKQQETVKKENLKIGELNKFINDAQAAHTANNDAQAVAIMQQATQAGSNYDQVWG
ncbi:MAG: carboxypeptidase-like regulatory domain-containing protein, partial [Ktedonobacteraceae bacterium]